MSKKSKILIAVLAALVVAFVLVGIVFRPQANKDQKQIEVVVVHSDGEKNTFNIASKAEYLREPLEAAMLVSGSETEYGLFIDTVDGEKVDASKEEWWGYTVNGEMAMYGVDQQVINDGDIIEFTFNVGY